MNFVFKVQNFDRSTKFALNAPAALLSISIFYVGRNMREGVLFMEALKSTYPLGRSSNDFSFPTTQSLIPNVIFNWPSFP